MASELLNVLFRRKKQVDEHGETWESIPNEASADVASTVEGLKFDGPSADSWLQSLEPETAEGLAEVLKMRGFRPSHAPAGPPEQEAKLLDHLTKEVTKLKHVLETERRAVGSSKDELERREIEITRREADLEAQRMQLETRQAQRGEYPQPSWLTDLPGTLNIAVVGNSGVGKSLLINALRGLKDSKSPGWAPVGVKETTFEPEFYTLSKEAGVRLWDLPGAGTEAFPRDSYISQMGLRYFDKVIVVTALRYTQVEKEIMDELVRYDVPLMMVRTKVDNDVRNNHRDNGMCADDTVALIREDLKMHCGVARPYVISSTCPDGYDFPELLKDLFPEKLQGAETGGEDAWALPNSLSIVFSGLQGQWLSQSGLRIIVNQKEAHITMAVRGASVYPLEEHDGKVWWGTRWYVDAASIRRYVKTNQMVWNSASAYLLPMVWTPEKEVVRELTKVSSESTGPKRIDPDDKKWYTINELEEKYKEKSLEEIRKYWVSKCRGDLQIDPDDQLLYTFAELQSKYNGAFSAGVSEVVVYWLEECEEEKRSDPDDRKSYTLSELHQKYKDHFPFDEIMTYWNCIRSSHDRPK